MLVRRLAKIPDSDDLLGTLLALPRATREKLQHLVEALAIAPPEARNRAVPMIRRIVNTRHDSQLDCLRAIEQVIKYLKQASRVGTRRQQRVHGL